MPSQTTPKFKNESQSFRHRGFHDAEKDVTVMIYGDGPEPTDSQGQPLKKIWDHDVSEVISVTDHV